MSCPNRETLPPWPFNIPVSIFCVVDFPEPFGTQEAENLPVLHGEVQAVEGLLVFAVGERQVFNLDHSSSPHFPRGPFFSRWRLLHHFINLTLKGMEIISTAIITSHQYHAKPKNIKNPPYL